MRAVMRYGGISRASRASAMFKNIAALFVTYASVRTLSHYDDTLRLPRLPRHDMLRWRARYTLSEVARRVMI